MKSIAISFTLFYPVCLFLSGVWAEIPLVSLTADNTYFNDDGTVSFSQDGTEYTLITSDCVLGCKTGVRGNDAFQQDNTPTFPQSEKEEPKTRSKLRKRAGSDGEKTTQHYLDNFGRWDSLGGERRSIRDMDLRREHRSRVQQAQPGSTEQPTPQANEQQEVERQCEAPQTETSEEIIPWANLLPQPQDLAKKWLESKIPGYGYWRAVPGKLAVSLYPLVTEKGKLFKFLPEDIRKQMTPVFFRQSLNFHLSAEVLYSLVRTTEGVYPSDPNAPDSAWDQLMLAGTVAMRERLNDVKRNIYPGDSFCSQMRDQLIIEAIKIRSIFHTENFIKAKDSPGQVMDLGSDALLEAFEWKKMTLGQAISLRSLMKELFTNFKDMITSVKLLVNHLSHVSITDRLWGLTQFKYTQEKLGIGLEAYELAMYTLDLAIETRSLSFSEPKPGQSKLLLVDNRHSKGPFRLKDYNVPGPSEKPDGGGPSKKPDGGGSERLDQPSPKTKKRKGETGRSRVSDGDEPESGKRQKCLSRTSRDSP